MTISLAEHLKVQDHKPWVWMHIGAQQTQLRYGGAGVAAQERTLALGTLQVGARAGQGGFRAVPPSELELENAIASVEDVVMPLAKILPPDAVFFAGTDDAQSVFMDLGAGDTLELAQVEDLFNTLAAYVQGRPYASDNPLVQPAGAAQVLILRETMHHLGFASVRWV